MFDIKCIIGLCNKDDKYNFTRHNIGKDFLIWLAEKENLKWIKEGLFNYSILELNDKKIFLIIPETYMNECGVIVSKIKKFFKKAEEILIVCDDLQVAFGKSVFRKNFDRGERGHNGLRSINLNLKNNNFKDLPYYFSLGIGRPAKKEEVGNFVLQKFSKEEQIELSKYFNIFYDDLRKNIF